ncbi:RagB/SusD family nutrient uptake outer membrane protein [uncultured Prevotella sp.]|uniref:RagB/SusD family nutrient uptake outer membrane protein n=1 Tax=uncultured Prevotella sp. TaxID=159272 RepID=UPI0025F730DA|nr:RagB/SusD family nutrient uptake outer membrane protein [uncultured Prevotella sp.]
MKSKINIKKYMWAGMFAVALGATMTSCDPLGVEPTTKVDEARFWQNPQLARTYVNNFYFIAPSYSGHDFQTEQWSDNCQGNSEQDWDTYRQNKFNNRQYDETSPWSGPWSGSYQNLYNIHIGMEKIASSGALNEQIKSQLLAECYFFRAWVYFDMEKFWGTVPYVDHALSLDENTYLPQTKRETLFDNMLADLDKSIELFGKMNGTPEIGMVNINVAKAFKSRVALYAANAASASAKGIYTDDAAGLFKFEKNAQHYYQIAYDAAKDLIGKYDLEPNYEDLFTSETAHTSVESIWPVMFKENQRGGFNPTEKNGPDGAYYGNSDKKTLSWDMRSGLFPTQDLVDCYLQKDEADGKWKHWWETKQAQDLNIAVTTDKDGNKQYSGSGDNYRKMFENRDQRFYATVTYDGAYMGPVNNPIYQIQTWIDKTTMNDQRTLKYSALHTGYRSQENLSTAPVNRASCQTITGYYSRKYSHFDQFNDDGSLKKTQRTTCYFNIRYAEVLLNLAEAAVNLDKSAEAIAQINKIRERAGMSAYDGATDKQSVYDEVKVERRLEFAFENPGFRYFDLLRWSEAEGKTVIPELNKVSRGIQIFRVGIHSDEVGKNGVALNPGETNEDGHNYETPSFQTVSMDYDVYKRKFDNQRYYFTPFVSTMLVTYKQLQQSPGWKGFKYE